MKNLTLIFLLFFLPVTMIFAQVKHRVIMTENAFSPSTLNIEQGDMVTWVNNGAVIHTSTSGTDCTPGTEWNSGNINPGDSFTHVFSNEGTFPYFCIPHCAMGMTGNITVNGTSSVKTEIKPETNISVSPNPATFFLEISGINNSKTNTSYTLYDVTGRIHRNERENSSAIKTGRYRMEISDLPSGTYILQVIIDNQLSHVCRVIKN